MMNPVEHIKIKKIRIKTLMLTSSLCDYSGAYILISGNLTKTRAEADNAGKQLEGKKE